MAYILTYETEEKWLIVYDNAEKPGGLEESNNPDIFDHLWPRSQTGAVLITSRDRNVTRFNENELPVELVPLAESEAIEMLLTQTLIDPTVQNKGEAQEIVKRNWCHPLTIQTSIGLIKQHNCTLNDYNGEWRTPERLVEDSANLENNNPLSPYENQLSQL